jgi:benzoyl-CoA reductase/2-hydroxyglutaryl-CoA dehydratase subunit BcrC/BadD/HgdB
MADLVVAETTCDGKKKMYELMADSRPMFILRLPHQAEDPGSGGEALDQWLGEIRRLKAELERRFRVTITDSRLREAISLMNRERRLRRGLAGLMKRQQPPLTGRELLDLRSSISGLPDDLAQYEAALARLETSPGTTRRAVRVLMTGVPMVTGAERVLDLVEAAGGIVVAMENCSGLKPILEDVDENAPDPLRAIAEKYLHLPCSVMTRNSLRLGVLRSLAAEYRPDCVIELIWQACLTYAVEAHYVRRLCEQLHLPYLRIETDYSPSDSARLATRIEALYETARQRGSTP